jgi:hypothetical protein
MQSCITANMQNNEYGTAPENASGSNTKGQLERDSE